MSTTVKHNVGTCPACRSFLWAEVEIDVVVGEPTMSREGRAHVFASPKFLGMTVGHSCQRDEDDSWTVEETGR